MLTPPGAGRHRSVLAWSAWIRPVSTTSVFIASIVSGMRSFGRSCDLGTFRSTKTTTHGSSVRRPPTTLLAMPTPTTFRFRNSRVSWIRGTLCQAMPRSDGAHRYKRIRRNRASVLPLRVPARLLSSHRRSVIVDVGFPPNSVSVERGALALDSGDIAWVIAATALVMIMTPALGFFYGGLVRRKNLVSTIAQCFADLRPRQPGVGPVGLHARPGAVLQRLHR